MKLPLEKRTPGAIKSLQMSQAVQFMETNEPEVFKAFSKPALSRICGTLKCGMKTYYCLPNAGVSSTHAAASLTTCPEPLQVNGVDFFKCVFGQRNREDILPPHEVSFLPAQPALSNRQLDVCQVPSCENVVRLLLPACHLHTASMNARLTCHLDKWAAAC